MKIQYTDDQNDSILFTDARGIKWSTTLSGDGQISQAARDAVRDGIVPVAYVAPPKPFGTLAKPAFMYVLDTLNITEAHVLGAIAAMPESNADELKAKRLAGFVFKYQNDFNRENPLLNALATSLGFTTKQIDDGWREGESLSW